MNYNTTPLPRVLNSRDPVTGKKLVKFSRGKKRYIPNLGIPTCKAGEEHLVENYDQANKDNFKGWVCHHRLELTLDGEFANSAIDLVNKGIYFHRPYFELIWLRHGDHARLHRTRDKQPNWKGGVAKDRTKYMKEYRAKKRSV